MSTDNSLTGTLWHTADFDTDRHLKLLGLGFDQPSYELLVQLHTRHVHTFPFCAVDVLLDDHPGVEPATVSRRILVEGQGGYCFEHAQLLLPHARHSVSKYTAIWAVSTMQLILVHT